MYPGSYLGMFGYRLYVRVVERGSSTLFLPAKNSKPQHSARLQQYQVCTSTGHQLVARPACFHRTKLLPHAVSYLLTSDFE